MIDLKKKIIKKRYNEKEKKCQRRACVRIARETKDEANKKREKKEKIKKRKPKKKIKDLEKDNSLFFFFVYTCDLVLANFFL